MLIVLDDELSFVASSCQEDAFLGDALNISQARVGWPDCQSLQFHPFTTTTATSPSFVNIIME